MPADTNLPRIWDGAQYIDGPPLGGYTADRPVYQSDLTAALAGLSGGTGGGVSTAYVDGKIAGLVGAAPSALDTLKEIDDQLAADEGSAAALASTVAGKMLKGNVVTKTANYTAVVGDVVLADTTGGTFAITIPAASGGRGRVVVKWVAGSVAPTINLTGADHVNMATGVQTFTPVLLNQGYQLESDGTSLWAVTADDLPLSLLDTRYAAAATLGTAATKNVGTTTGTVAAGDDSRIVAAGNAVPSTLVDAKGDLLVGTADNTVTRLAIGTDGTVLTADSTQTAGAKWSAVPAPGPTYNLLPQNYKKWRRALSKVRAGTANAVVCTVGDSTTRGSVGGTIDQPHAYPTILAGLLNSYYVPCVNSWTTAFNAGTSGVVDPRVTWGGSWVNSAGYWSMPNAGSGTLSYAPGTGSVDTIDVYSIQGNGGSLAVNINGGATVGTIAATGSLGVKKTTITFTATANPTINFVASAVAAEADIIAINAYLSTSRAVQICNVGVGGTTTSSGNGWSQATGGGGVFSYANYAANFSADLSIIDLGINDAGSSVAAATYSTNMQTIITRAQATGDVLLKSFVPSNTTPYTTIEPTYLPVLNTLAASNNCALLDGFSRWESYAISNPLGYYSDGLHPTQFGYSDVAQAVFNALKTL